jgi:hypothetical protein
VLVVSARHSALMPARSNGLLSIALNARKRNQRDASV